MIPATDGAPPGAAPPPAMGQLPAKTLLVTAIAVLVVIVLVVAALWVGGVGPFSRGNGDNGAGATFSEAFSEAQTAANSQSGGPWTLTMASGLFSITTGEEPLSNFTRPIDDPKCNVSAVAGAPSELRVPASSASPSSGAASTWIFEYSSATAFLTVWVSGSIAQPLLLKCGGSCSPAKGGVVTNPADLIDSSAAASAAWNAGGASFASNHSGKIDATYIYMPTLSLPGAGTVRAALWIVDFTNCNFASFGPGTLDGAAVSEFAAAVNATTGAVTDSGPGLFTCGPQGGAGG